MSRKTMYAAAVLVILFTVPSEMRAGAAAPVRHQGSSQATPADAAPFIGDWTLAMQGPNGPASFSLSVKVEKEKVVGEITGDTGEPHTMTDISKSGKGLAMSYSFLYEGNPVPTVLTLKPGAEGNVDAALDFAGGAYVMSGTATKKDKAK